VYPAHKWPSRAGSWARTNVIHALVDVLKREFLLARRTSRPKPWDAFRWEVAYGGLRSGARGPTRRKGLALD
jgi:hypothetical protein